MIMRKGILHEKWGKVMAVDLQKVVIALKKLLVILTCIGMLRICPVHAQTEKLIALTFDDGPSGKYTRNLLDGLYERDVKATFLLCGYRMEQYPELTDRIHREGHEIGLHGYSHKSMKNMCSTDVMREIERAMSLVPEDCEISFLRSPGGACGPCVYAAAASFGLSVLSWSVDPRDWATHDAAAIEREVVDHVRDGDVILLHDMSDSSVEAALVIVDELQEQGFRFVTVSELAEARDVAIIAGKEYAKFYVSDPS